MLPFIENYDRECVRLSSQIPDHLKCGEVYTWLCNGEIYAVECSLCEDKPLCPLSEFPQHMEVWHTHWEEHNESNSDTNEQQDHLFDDDEEGNEENSLLSSYTEDSGLYEQDYMDNVEVLEPFEQVLIEQDETIINSIQNNEDVVVDSDNDGDEENDNNDDICAKENKTALLHQAELKGEIVLEQVEQHKENLINKTITEKYNNKCKQNYENKLNKINEMEHTREVKKMETRGNHNQNKDIKENVTDLFTTKNLKRNCTKREHLKRKNYKSFGNIRYFNKIKNKFLENNNLSTIKSLASEIKENGNISQKISDVEQKFEENTSFLAEATLSSDLEQSSTASKGTNLTDIEEDTQEFKNCIHNIKNSGEIKDYLIENASIIRKNLSPSVIEESSQEYDNLQNIKAYSSDSKSNIQKIRDSSDLQEALLENELRHTSTFEEHSLQHKFGDLVQLKQSSLNKHCFTKGTKVSCTQKITDSSDHDESSSNNSKDFEEMLEQSLKDPNDLENKVLDYKPRGLEVYLPEGRTSTPEIKDLNIEENFQDFEDITEYIQISRDSKKFLHKSQSLMEEFSNLTNIEENFPHFESSLQSISLNSRSFEECSLENVSLTNEIRYSSDGEQIFPENEDLIYEVDNSSGNIEDQSLENLNLTEKLTSSNNFAESLLEQESTVSDIFDNTTISFEMIQKLQGCHEKISLEAKANIISNANSVEEKGNINVYEEETGDKSQIGIKQCSEDCKQIFIIKPKECKKDTKIQDEIRIVQEGEAVLNRNFSNNEVNSAKNVLEETRNETKLREHSKCNEKTANFNTKAIAFRRSSKRNKNSKVSLGSGNEKRRCEKTDLVSQLNNDTNKTVAKISVLSMQLRSNSRKTCENEEPSDDTQVSESSQLFENSCAAQVSRDSSIKKIKQTRVDEYFKNQTINTTTELTDKSQSKNCSSSFKSNDSVITDSAQTDKTEESKSEICSLDSSPLSPKTEEEHFELYEPKQKLTKHHISHLIELYKKHPRLWDQSHPEFCEPHLCRKSWQEITDLWNEYCKRNFTIAEVRIRICTLCQRYLQERERLVLEGELDEFAKFPYYEQMRFLEHQKSLQKRKDLYDQQNEKIVEIYKHFPVLWHVKYYKLRQAKERADAFQSISKALKLCDIHLSAVAVQKRIRSLKKCYRLEKIRYLHALVEQTPFESSFKHYDNMQFLDKHIDPFVCPICGKIFENLTGFREHLEEENHGSILQEDSESDSEQAEDEKGKLQKVRQANIDGNSQHYNTNTAATLENKNNTPKFSAENDKPIIQEVLILPPNGSQATVLINFPVEDQIIEQVIENVSNTESFGTQTLDNFISCEDTCVTSTPIKETVATMPLCLETSHNKLNIQEQSPECTSYEDLAKQDLKTTMVNQNSLETEKESDFSNSLLVKVQCADFSLDLKLGAQQEALNDSENEFQPVLDTCSTALAEHEIRKMIELYRKYPQLWNPNHLDYNSRNLRRQAWFTLTAEFCEAVGKQFSWRTLHRKLTDYAKYYKKLMMEQEDYEEVTTKWTFYENFKFLDDVIAVHDELQRSVHHRDNNFKIIAIYETLPQLWNIKHPDYNKRCLKQRNIELMCNRLQEDNNFQITSERLKNRLIELRAQYRLVKKQRLKCEKNQQKFFTDFEFYEALKFLDDHIDPFICKPCKMEFKKLTDYNYHQKRQHNRKSTIRNTPLSRLPPTELEQDGLIENVCHICGIKFTTRSNLMHHIKRHEGIRNYACTMCPKKFFASHSLKVHIRSHTKECPYTCEKCGMSFVSASKLNQHVKRHSNKKDFTCNYCPKAFYTAFERDRHERRHLNIRDKACSICGKTFVAGSSYYAHMMLHNDTKRFKCDKCDMKFAQYAGLYKHKKRHHTGIEECK